MQAMGSDRAALIEVPLGAGLKFPIGPGLVFAHHYTQSQAVVPAYRGSLGCGAFLTPPAHRRGISALCWEAMEGRSEEVDSVAGDRDTVELYLEGMPLPPERLEGLAREVEGVFRRYLEVERVRLLTGEDERGRRWLRVAAVLK